MNYQALTEVPPYERAVWIDDKPQPSGHGRPDTMNKFSVTFDIVTPESSETGGISEDGVIAENVSLRDAINYLMETRTSLVGGVEYASSGDDYITVQNGMEFETGAFETRRLHFPITTTDASWERLIRIVEGRVGFNFHNRR